MEVNFKKEMFEPLAQEGKQNAIVRPSETYWQDAWRRLKENKVAMFSLVVLALLIVIVIVGPYLYPFDHRTNDMKISNIGPNGTHWFGTDDLGRDLFARVLYGSRISLAVGIVSALINLVIGVLYGGISGFYGGNLDNLMMRIVDILYSVPMILYVILLMVWLQEASITNVFIAMGISFWLGMARLVRGQVLSLKQQEYVLAARALGARDKRILLRHLIPNSMGAIIVTVVMAIPNAIFTEAFLSFIGLGVSAPGTSLGMLAQEATQSYKSFPHQLLFPSLAICLIMLSFNLFGDGLRDALDPKMRK